MTEFTEQQLEPVWVVIPAAGLGRRMKSDLPKQYLKIHDKCVIEHTLECFLNHDDIAGIIVVLNPYDSYWKSLNISSRKKPIHTVEGGFDRSDSVLNGLNFLLKIHEIPVTSWVMVHDAARPCLSKIDIDSLLELRTQDCVGGILASPVRDTMKRTKFSETTTGKTETITHTESRDNLCHALTPQMFRIGELTEALEFCSERNIVITDECSAMEEQRTNPVIVEGSHNNIKITYPSDLSLAAFLMAQAKVS